MSFFVDSIEKIIEDYSRISERVCIICGNPATKISTGWICPYCDEHANNKYEHYITIDEYFKEINDDE